MVIQRACTYLRNREHSPPKERYVLDTWRTLQELLLVFVKAVSFEDNFAWTIFGIELLVLVKPLVHISR